jgi:hypothetical protein
MKTINKSLALAALAYAIIALGACSKTGNSGSSGTTASTPPNTSTCSVNSSGQVVNGSGAVCTTGTFTCPAQGFYTDQYNNHINCTAGQVVTLNYTGGGTCNNPPPGSGCEYYSQCYNSLYVPMLLNNKMVCVNYDWLNQYTYGSQYFDDYNQYYNNPPYNGGGCGFSAYLDVGPFSGEICFGN